MSFEPVGLGATIFKDRYTVSEETFDLASRRVAEHNGSAEENGKRDLYTERFYGEISNNYFMPGGRIWYASGRPRAQGINCFVLGSPSDSREGWGEVTSDVIVVSGMMGGIGVNMSTIRPRGTPIHGTGGFATGAVSLMQLINGVGDVIVGGGGRRMALMLCLDINHPDIEEFLNVKLNLHELNNANISIVLPAGFSAEHLQKLIADDGEIPLEFNGIKTGKSISARWLWNLLVDNAWTSGEPGVLNMDFANRENNIAYDCVIQATNPCGEQPLPANGSCVLGALVLPRFIVDGKIDYAKLEESTRLAVRFLDNVVTVNHYPLPKIQQRSHAERRIGLGIMGLHTMLLEMGIKYSDPKGFRIAGEVMAFIKHAAYGASIDLAIEKGPFPLFKKDFLDSGYMRRMKRSIRTRIAEYGIRNCCILTVAPTGTTSIVSGVSSGIEPLPPAVYYRNYYAPTTTGSRELKRELVVEEAYNKYPGLIESAIDISVEDHFKMLTTVQEHVDSGVSKTINMPSDFPKDKFGDIWLKNLPYCKGTTVYRYGSRENEPINPVPREQWDKIVTDHATGSALTAEEVQQIDCPTGVCSF